MRAEAHMHMDEHTHTHTRTRANTREPCVCLFWGFSETGFLIKAHVSLKLTMYFSLALNTKTVPPASASKCRHCRHKPAHRGLCFLLSFLLNVYCFLRFFLSDNVCGQITSVIRNESQASLPLIPPTVCPLAFHVHYCPETCPRVLSSASNLSDRIQLPPHITELRVFLSLCFFCCLF